MAQYAQGDESSPLDQLPPDVVDALPEDIVAKLEDGTLDQIPSETLEGMRPEIADKVPDSLAAVASDNPGLAAVLIAIGLASVVGAIWGAAKGFIKVALVLGVIAAVCWYVFFRV